MELTNDHPNQIPLCRFHHELVTHYIRFHMGLGKSRNEAQEIVRANLQQPATNVLSMVKAAKLAEIPRITAQAKCYQAQGPRPKVSRWISRMDQHQKRLERKQAL